VRAGTTRRIAWWDGAGMGAIKYASDSGAGPSVMGGPLKCASGCATILHVVPDPTAPTGFFALCEGPSVDRRTVVRVDAAAGCTKVLDGMGFGAESRLSRLGIAP
jgi:hypothetical protein